MRQLFREAIQVMEVGFRRLEAQVPRPQSIVIDDNIVFRYSDKNIQQAMIQKLARYISGLNAADILILSGYLQEEAVIKRTLDEIGEDITFLALGLNQGITPLHERYLESFWQEEFDEGATPIQSTKRRDQMRRAKIRSAIERLVGSPPGSRAGSILSQVYSGYVHAASPFIMEMCEGGEYRFSTSGIKNRSLIKDHVEDFWNYNYRGLQAVMMVARVLGDSFTVESIHSYAEKFEKSAGANL